MPRAREAILAALRLLTRGEVGAIPPEARSEAAAWAARAAAWRYRPEILGFGASTRTAAGRVLPEWAFKVYVVSKRPWRSIEAPVPPRLRIPGLDVEIPTDVEVQGRMGPQSIPGLTHRVRGGSAIGHFAGETGTLGCLVRKRGDARRRFLLSNSHVIALSGNARVGDPVVFPSPEFGGVRTVARLTEWEPFVEGGGFPNKMDAAIAEVVDRNVSAAVGDRLPNGVGNFLSPGDPVHMVGARSGSRTSTVRDPHYTFNATGYRRASGAELTLGFHDQVLCHAFTQTGDSGAAVMNARGRLVGLHFWGDATSSVFNRVRPILGRFGLEAVLDERVGARGPSPPEALVPGVSFQPPVDSRARAIDTLARTIWGESRGQPDPGMQAVANVVVNRTLPDTPKWWGSTVERVCRHRRQFSCWNVGDANLPKLQRVNTSDRWFPHCIEIATQAVDGQLPDVTLKALHYHRFDVSPRWSRGHVPCVEIGDHVFFNDTA